MVRVLNHWGPDPVRRAMQNRVLDVRSEAVS
jgi:hypothetical protein